MATSSIFANIVIKDAETAEKFITALEESEKAQAKKKRTAPIIPVLKDPDEIRKLVAKRFSNK
ncbi:MAG: hypothetical protein IJA00_04085 [Bacteroidaceae bacterium]|nr:hypothetical protein [Bacteroidaceae bacterium]